MARLSKEEHEGYLSRLAEHANADTEMMDLIGKLRSDFDESLTVDMEEVRKEWESKYNTVISERDKAIGERDESRRAYRERFFSSNREKEASQIMERERRDNPMGMNELLGIKKGD